MAILEVDNLRSKYTFNGPEILKGISFQVEEDDFFAIIGPSGAGKSTLIRCINRLIEPSSGSIKLHGTEMLLLKAGELRRIRRHIGMIFQEFNLVNNLSSINNVLTGLLNSSSKFLSMFYLFTKEQKLNALQALDTVGLLEKSYNRVDELSGGQRQRVGIARAIIKKPILLLADEPVASLDPKAALSTMKLLKKINKDFNITILCNLHQTNLAMEFSDRVIGLSDGSIVFDEEAKFLEKNINKLYS